MPHVEYDGAACELRDGETVLDGLLRHGIAVPHACKAGSCGSCMMRAINAGPPFAAADSAPAALPAEPTALAVAVTAAQAGLKPAWRAQGYFLACLCKPEGSLVAAPVGADVRAAASIVALERLTDSVLRVRLAAAAPLDYRSGQFITVLRGDGLARSYSIASLPTDDSLELHVRVLPAGRMSQWLAATAKVGTPIEIQGPSGDCFYTAGREDQPLLLAGTGTGLAPLFGIARDALRQGHRAPVYLFHGALTAAGLYLQGPLAQLAAAHSNFHYMPTTLDADGPMDQAVLKRLGPLKGWRAFVCGDPAIVQAFKRKIFLAGAALNDIHADAFLPSAT
ncbi:MAG: FAD-binding oxidoreductase [Vicinamibacterales bacterium]